MAEHLEWQLDVGNGIVPGQEVSVHVIEDEKTDREGDGDRTIATTRGTSVGHAVGRRDAIADRRVRGDASRHVPSPTTAVATDAAAGGFPNVGPAEMAPWHRLHLGDERRYARRRDL